MANLWNTALDYGYVKGENLCRNMTIEKNVARDQAWTKEEFDRFCSVAQEKGYNGLYVAMHLAYYTAQRQTDIFDMKWKQIDSELQYISITQSKTGAKVQIPLLKLNRLRTVLLENKKNDEYVVVDQFDNKPYGHRIRLFADRFDEVRKLSGVRKELLFRDLRRTAILALDEAGCSPSEISSVSGHSRSSIIAMLEVYAPKSREKAERAIGRLGLE